MWFPLNKLAPWFLRFVAYIVQLLPISQPGVSPPVLIDISVPYTSLSLNDTRTLAFEYVMRIRHAWKGGFMVVLRLNAPKGGGKSAFVTQIMQLLSCTGDNFGSISFQRVAIYTINHDGCMRRVLHMDPNMTGTRHLHTLHDPLSEYDLVLMEHGDDTAYTNHTNQLKELKKVVEVSINIDVGENIPSSRLFTTTSSTMLPAPPSLSHKWTGSLLKKDYAPDARMSVETTEELIKLQKDRKLCGEAIETSCDDTCGAISVNGKEVWRSTITFVQQDQKIGKGGVDPLKTANGHKKALIVLQAEMDEYLRANNLTPHYIAATGGPGLALSLVEGIYHAQKRAYDLGIPIIHLDHIMGHAITPMMDNPRLKYPHVCQIMSGGHSLTMLVRSATDMVRVCWSLSDAWGEVFDKVGRELGRHEIPTGPAMEKVMNNFMDGDKVWSKVLPTTTIEEIQTMVSEYPIDKQNTVQTHLEEYHCILKAVYGGKSVTTSLDPSHVKGVLNERIAKDKKVRYSKADLLVEFIRAFLTKEPTKKDIVTMINSVIFAADTRADTILSKLRMESPEPSLYQHQINRYRQHLETKDNKTPIFKDFVAQTMTETSLPEPTQSLYSAVLHEVVAKSCIADDMTAHAQYPDVTNYSITGGVGGNLYIGDVIDAALKKVGLTFQRVEPRNCSDNAAMIAELAHRVLTEAITAFPNTDELVDKLFKSGMGMVALEPTLKSVKHGAEKRWSGPTVI